MPVHEVHKSGKVIGFRWGKSGKLYLISEYGKEKAYALAVAQGRAVHASGWKESKESVVDVLEGEAMGNTREDLQFFIPISETQWSDRDDKKLLVTALINGWSSNNNFYSPQIAESLASKLLEDRKVFADHRFDPESKKYGRKITEWCATVEDAEGKDGKTTATIALTANPQTQWLYEEAKAHPSEIGISIDARAKVKDGEVSGKKGQIVEEFLKAHIDIVPNPSAGGRVERVVASYIDDKGEGEGRELTEVSPYVSMTIEELEEEINGIDYDLFEGEEVKVEITRIQEAWEDKKNWTEIRYRVKDPKLFEGEMKRFPLPGIEGITLIIGRLKNPPAGHENAAVTQAYRFDKKSFTLAQAKKWIQDHKPTKKESFIGDEIMTAKELKEQFPEVYAEIQKEALLAQKTESVEELEKELSTLKESLEKTQKDLEAKATELSTAKTELEQATKKIQVSERKNLVAQLLKESDLREDQLPDFFRNRLMEAKEEEVKSFVEAVKSLVQEKSGEVHIEPNVTPPPNPTASRKAMTDEDAAKLSK